MDSMRFANDRYEHFRKVQRDYGRFINVLFNFILKSVKISIIQNLKIEIFLFKNFKFEFKSHFYALKCHNLIDTT